MWKNYKTKPKYKNFPFYFNKNKISLDDENITDL